VSSYEVIKDKQKTISRLYDPTFDPSRNVILEEDPGLSPASNYAPGEAKILSYSPNKVVVETNSSTPGLLFLSDTYYPGWKSFVNGEEVKILKADYALRAVPITPGRKEIIFVYDPLSFKLGVFISGVCILVLAGLAINWRKK
jgi:uncharacterized membrane protein YfhO